MFIHWYFFDHIVWDSNFDWIAYRNLYRIWNMLNHCMGYRFLHCDSVWFRNIHRIGFIHRKLHLDWNSLFHSVRDMFSDRNMDGVRPIYGHFHWVGDMLLYSDGNFLLNRHGIRFWHWHRVRTVHRNFDWFWIVLNNLVRFGHFDSYIIGL
uniref:Uncharacterized protein n=1 Tax=Cacopsylla melanoneura TaxID=428564 RepID=A0A8D8ZCN4_9HEMI